MTWLLVSTSPSALSTIPVPAAASLLYWSAVLTITRPGLTFAARACSPLGSGGAEAAGAGTAPLPGRETPPDGLKKIRIRAAASPAPRNPIRVCVSTLPLPLCLRGRPYPLSSNICSVHLTNLRRERGHGLLPHRPGLCESLDDSVRRGDWL